MNDWLNNDSFSTATCCLESPLVCSGSVVFLITARKLQDRRSKDFWSTSPLGDKTYFAAAAVKTRNGSIAASYTHKPTSNVIQFKSRDHLGSEHT